MTNATNPEHDDRIEDAAGAAHDETPESDAGEAQSELTPEQRIEQLEADLAEMENKYQRSLADFQNYQRRAARSEQQARTHGADRVLASIIPVLDHFDHALKIDLATATPDQVAAGVRVIQDELVKALTTHGVEQLAPQPGEEFDPNRHEALMRQPAGEHAPGSVVQLLQPGYAVGERVIRPAKVAVAEGDS